MLGRLWELLFEPSLCLSGDRAPGIGAPGGMLQRLFRVERDNHFIGLHDIEVFADEFVSKIWINLARIEQFHLTFDSGARLGTGGGLRIEFGALGLVTLPRDDAGGAVDRMAHEIADEQDADRGEDSAAEIAEENCPVLHEPMITGAVRSG